MLESLTSNVFNYHKLTAEEQAKRGILGRLVGIIADYKNPTRNGRKYSEKLWEKVFDDDIMKEKIANRCCFGELGHPEDRTEIDMSKIAICLAEVPKKGSDGNLHGVFDILDTPNGRILKALCDYGCNIGISSRGSGDLYYDETGSEAVDPSTYECECWDAVLLPAVKTARLKYVTESLNNDKSLKQVLTESLEKATPNDRAIMEETLQNLHIDIEEPKTYKFNVVLENGKSINYSIKSKRVNSLVEALDRVKSTYPCAKSYDLIEDVDEEHVCEKCHAAEGTIEDSGKFYCEKCAATLKLNDINKNIIGENLNIVEASKAFNGGLLDELQSALTSNQELKTQVAQLQEQLSLCYAKETKTTELLEKYSSQIDSLKRINESTTANKKLNEELASCKAKITAKDNVIKELNSKIESLRESVNEYEVRLGNNQNTVDNLQGNISSINSTLNETVALNESLRQENAQLLQSKDSLDNDIKLLNEKFNRLKTTANRYKAAANEGADRYIQLQATRLGITPNEIKNRLAESYTFDDIDNVCNTLQQYNLNISNLPFDIKQVNSGKIKFTEGVDKIVPRNEADEIDDDLFRLANLK